MDEELRCFVGFELTEASRSRLAERVDAVHASFRERARWAFRKVRPENWHATLLFFPALSAAERGVVWQTVETGVRDGAWHGLTFNWRELALWPNPRRPSLICLEAEPYSGAAEWPVAPLLATPPFNRADTRHYSPFRPHITVIRFDRRWGPLLRAEWAETVAGLPPLEPGAIRFDRVSFLLSTLSPQQPVYPRERTLAL